MKKQNPNFQIKHKCGHTKQYFVVPTILMITLVGEAEALKSAKKEFKTTLKHENCNECK